MPGNPGVSLYSRPVPSPFGDWFGMDAYQRNLREGRGGGARRAQPVPASQASRPTNGGLIQPAAAATLTTAPPAPSRSGEGWQNVAANNQWRDQRVQDYRSNPRYSGSPSPAPVVDRAAPPSAPPGLGGWTPMVVPAARNQASAATTMAQQHGGRPAAPVAPAPAAAPVADLNPELNSKIEAWAAANRRPDLTEWMKANRNSQRGVDGRNIVERFLDSEEKAGRLGSPNYFAGFNAEGTPEQAQRSQQVWNMAGKGQLPEVADMSGAGIAPAFNPELTPEQRQASEQMWQMAAREELPNLAGPNYSVRPSETLQGFEVASASAVPQNLLAEAGVSQAEAQKMGTTWGEGFTQAQSQPGGFGGVGNITDPQENRKANLLLNRYTSAITGAYR